MRNFLGELTDVSTKQKHCATPLFGLTLDMHTHWDMHPYCIKLSKVYAKGKAVSTSCWSQCDTLTACSASTTHSSTRNLAHLLR